MKPKTTTEKILENPDYFLEKEKKPKEQPPKKPVVPRSATAFIDQLETSK